MRPAWGPAPARIKGQPLAVMALILTGWVGFRASVIELPRALDLRHVPLIRQSLPAVRPGALAPTALGSRDIGVVDLPNAAVRSLEPGAPPPPVPLPQRPVDWGAAESGQRAAGQTLLWMAAMSDLPLPPEVARIARGDGAGSPASPSPDRVRAR